MSFIKEFKEFALKGNAVDMAVGIIIGAAFGKIVNSLVNDVIMPPIGMLLGGVDFSDLSITLKNATGTKEAVTINYGLFLNTIINFTIIALTIFIVIKAINTIKRRKKEVPTSKHCPECQMEIPINAQRCGHCTTKVET
ncbi:MAG: Large-conductance mechanosensitive channel [Chlamydiae bacterium]|nr:Large-conductance mechanosensitive channel [Chlamydiota bacterium]